MRKIFFILVFMQMYNLIFTQEISTNKLEEMSASDICYILIEDVYETFPEETSKYQTDLQRKMFEKSDEYKKLLAKLLNLKKSILSTKFSRKLLVDGQPYSLENYSIKNGGFILNLGHSFGLGGLREARYQYSILGFVNENLPVQKTIDPIFNDKRFVDYFIFLKCDENTALEIENLNNEGQLQIIMEFDIVSTVERTCQFTNYNSYNNNLETFLITSKYPVMKNTKLILQDTKTSKVLLEIQYK